VLDRDGPHRPVLRGRSRAGLATGGETRQGKNAYQICRRAHAPPVPKENRAEPDKRPVRPKTEQRPCDEQTRGCVHAQARKPATADARSCEGGPARG
jgi:hypothetical protein